MKTVYLIRHAKSSWKQSPPIADSERPLSHRGEKDCEKLKQLFQDYPIDLLMSSIAQRTVETAQVVADGAGLKHKDVVLYDSLYLAPATKIHSMIERCDDASTSVAVVAHNPWLTRLVEEYGYHIDNLPTAGVFCVQRPVEHRERIDPVLAQPVWFRTPKQWMNICVWSKSSTEI